MKSHVSVLFDPPEGGVLSRLEEVLEAYRLDEEDPESIRVHHWDYWILPEEGDFGDEELGRDFPAETEEMLANACYVRNLPADYRTSAIICDGRWLDLQDSGWRMMREPSRSNRKALEAWSGKCREVFAAQGGRICVRVITHC